MDTGKRTKDHTSYIFSREIILKSLLEKGIISDSDYERYDQMLYDRYHIDISLGVPRPTVNEAMEAKTHDASSNGIKDSSFVSLTAIAKKINPESPGYEIQSWLRDEKTIQFLRCWETQNNPEFSEVGFAAVLAERKSPSSTLSVKKWIEGTNAIGLQSKAGKTGGVLAHPIIACAFRAYLYPEFQFDLIQRYLSGIGEGEEKEYEKA